MATGTGKTRTAASFVKRLFEAGAVTRVLLLVDRIALAGQTEDAFTDHSSVSTRRRSVTRYGRPSTPATGFDCPEVVNLAMARFTRSAILYRQMRGRGTRKAEHIGKTDFTTFDFVGVTEFHGDRVSVT